MTAAGIALVIVTSVVAALVGDRALDPDVRRRVRARLRARRLRQHRERAVLALPYAEHQRFELERLRRHLLARRSRELLEGLPNHARDTEAELARIDAEIASLDGPPFTETKPPGPCPISPSTTSAAFGELRRHLLASQPRVGD